MPGRKGGPMAGMSLAKRRAIGRKGGIASGIARRAKKKAGQWETGKVSERVMVTKWRGFSSMSPEKRKEIARSGGLERQRKRRVRKTRDEIRTRTLETASLTPTGRQARFRKELEAAGILIDESEYPLPILTPGDIVRLNPKGREQFTTNRFEGAIFYGWNPRNPRHALLWVVGRNGKYRKDNLFGGWLEKSPEGRALLCPRCGKPGHEAKDCPEVGDFGWEDAEYMGEIPTRLEFVRTALVDPPFVTIKAFYEDGTQISHGGTGYALAALLLMDLYRIRSANVDIRIDDPVSWVHVLTHKEVK